jgi:hypothetical protein
MTDIFVPPDGGPKALHRYYLKAIFQGRRIIIDWQILKITESHR